MPRWQFRRSSHTGAGRLPDSLQALVGLDEHGTAYIDRSRVPVDPWGNTHFYVSPRAEDAYRLGSYGADGEPGGTSNDRDTTVQAIENREF